MVLGLDSPWFSASVVSASEVTGVVRFILASISLQYCSFAIPIGILCNSPSTLTWIHFVFSFQLTHPHALVWILAGHWSIAQPNSVATGNSGWVPSPAILWIKWWSSAAYLAAHHTGSHELFSTTAGKTGTILTVWTVAQLNALFRHKKFYLMPAERVKKSKLTKTNIDGALLKLIPFPKIPNYD